MIYRTQQRNDAMVEWLIAQYNQWRQRNGWSHGQVAIASKHLARGTLRADWLQAFVRGETRTLHHMDTLARLIDLIGDSVSFEMWERGIVDAVRAAYWEKQQTLMRRAQAVQAERESRRRAWLEREYRGQGRHPSVSKDDDRLDGATIAALSGGTMTGGLRA